MRFRVAVVALLAGCMVVLGAGCTTPKNAWEAKNQANWVGSFISFVLIYGLCTGTSFCPIPGDPLGTPIPPPAPVP